MSNLLLALVPFNCNYNFHCNYYDYCNYYYYGYYYYCYYEPRTLQRSTPSNLNFVPPGS